MLGFHTRGQRRQLLALALFVLAILAAFNIGSWSVYQRQRSTLERLLRQRLTTATRLIAAELAPFDLDFARDRAVYYLVRDVFREVQESDADLSAIVLLDGDNRVLVSYPPDEYEEGDRHPFADLDRGQILAAQGGLFVATKPQSQESLFFMNAYGPVVDLLGSGFVVGLKADVGYQKTIDSVRYGILVVNAVSGLAVVAFAAVYYRAGRRLAREEETTFRREKLATLGQLAGGVAHEIRNPLGVIKQAVFLLRKHEQMSPEGSQWLGYVEDAIQRMNHLVEDVLGYARKGGLDIKSRDLTKALDRALHLVDHRLRSSQISVEREYASPSPVPFDEGRIEQVALNLLLNAIEAMPEGGKVTVRTRENAGWAEIEVEDNGPGIPPEDLPHIMEPFHTRKESGTGLGLTIVRHIVESHGGQIGVRSRVGQGSCFTIRLPRAGPVRRGEEGRDAGPGPAHVRPEPGGDG